MRHLTGQAYMAAERTPQAGRGFRGFFIVGTLMASGEPLMTVAEVGRLLRRSTWSIYADAAGGRLPAIRVGGTVRFRWSEIEAWLDANRVRGSARKRQPVVAGQEATALRP